MSWSKFSCCGIAENGKWRGGESHDLMMIHPWPAWNPRVPERRSKPFPNSAQTFTSPPYIKSEAAISNLKVMAIIPPSSRLGKMFAEQNGCN
jgi:hypothetical protein